LLVDRGGRDKRVQDSVTAVGQWLGRSSPEITWRVYSYLMAADREIGPAAPSRALARVVLMCIRCVTGDRVAVDNRRSEPVELAAVLFDMDITSRFWLCWSTLIVPLTCGFVVGRCWPEWAGTDPDV